MHKNYISAVRKDSRKYIISRLEALGCKSETDDLGNVYVTLSGSAPDSKRIVMSCSDSSDNAGFCTAAELIAALKAEKIPHTHALTVLLWNDEPPENEWELVPAMGALCLESDKALHSSKVEFRQCCPRSTLRR